MGWPNCHYRFEIYRGRFVQWNLTISFNLTSCNVGGLSLGYCVGGKINALKEVHLVQIIVLTIVYFWCDKLSIKINNLLGEQLVVYRTSRVIYRDKSSYLAKCFVNSANRLNAFDFQDDYLINVEFVSSCWLCFVLCDKSTYMRKTIINKFDFIIIYLNYVTKIEMHLNK